MSENAFIKTVVDLLGPFKRATNVDHPMFGGIPTTRYGSCLLRRITKLHIEDGEKPGTKNIQVEEDGGARGFIGRNVILRASFESDGSTRANRAIITFLTPDSVIITMGTTGSNEQIVAHPKQHGAALWCE